MGRVIGSFRNSWLRFFVSFWLVLSALHFTSPGWAAPLPAGSVVYAVVPPLMGLKPLKGVTARLDSLKKLGIDAIWITCFNETDDLSHISYAVTDYFKLRPDFGSEEDLRELVQKAHRLGIKVLLDIVPGHTSTGHPYFVEAQRLGRASPYYVFYERDAQGNPKHYFDWYHLVNLNLHHPPAAQMVADSFLFWIQKMGVDGYRVDSAWSVRERTPAFFPRVRKELTKISSEAILIAEGSARDSYYLNNGFDYAYDWTQKVGEWAWHEIFASPAGVARRLHEVLLAEHGNRTLRFLNNNDTGQRFITRHGLAATQVASVLLFTIPGLPLLFTGDEVGEEYDPYVDGPPLAFHDRHGLRPFYQRLIELRKSVPALREGAWEPLLQQGEVFVYRRRRAKEEVLVALNFGGATRFTLDGKDSSSCRALLATGGASCRAGKGRKLELRMPRQSSVVFYR